MYKNDERKDRKCGAGGFLQIPVFFQAQLLHNGLLLIVNMKLCRLRRRFFVFFPNTLTCRVVYDTEHGGEAEVTEGTELYYSLLSAKPEDIKIKSGLLEWLSRYFNKME